MDDLLHSMASLDIDTKGLSSADPKLTLSYENTGLQYKHEQSTSTPQSSSSFEGARLETIPELPEPSSTLSSSSYVVVDPVDCKPAHIRILEAAHEEVEAHRDEVIDHAHSLTAGLKVTEAELEKITIIARDAMQMNIKDEDAKKDCSIDEFTPYVHLKMPGSFEGADEHGEEVADDQPKDQKSII